MVGYSISLGPQVGVGRWIDIYVERFLRLRAVTYIQYTKAYIHVHLLAFNSYRLGLSHETWT